MTVKQIIRRKALVGPLIGVNRRKVQFSLLKHYAIHVTGASILIFVVAGLVMALGGADQWASLGVVCIAVALITQSTDLWMLYCLTSGRVRTCTMLVGAVTEVPLRSTDSAILSATTGISVHTLADESVGFVIWKGDFINYSAAYSIKEGDFVAVVIYNWHVYQCFLLNNSMHIAKCFAEGK